MNGLCECGCGQTTKISNRTSTKRGAVKGQPLRFINGHNYHAKMPGNNFGERHGHRYTPENAAFRNAKCRCMCPTVKGWKDYGGRGIKFLFPDFPSFFAELGLRPEGKSLDRINNDGNYEPGNVRWATDSEQQHNQRRSKQCHS